VNLGAKPSNKVRPRSNSKITIKTDRGNANGTKNSNSKTPGPKYSSSLYEKPKGSTSLTYPLKMNKAPTIILAI
jgi:hypothetical protein